MTSQFQVNTIATQANDDMSIRTMEAGMASLSVDEKSSLLTSPKLTSSSKKWVTFFSVCGMIVGALILFFVGLMWKWHTMTVAPAPAPYHSWPFGQYYEVDVDVDVSDDSTYGPPGPFGRTVSNCGPSLSFSVLAWFAMDDLYIMMFGSESSADDLSQVSIVPMLNQDNSLLLVNRFESMLSVNDSCCLSVNDSVSKVAHWDILGNEDLEFSTVMETINNLFFSKYSHVLSEYEVYSATLLKFTEHGRYNGLHADNSGLDGSLAEGSGMDNIDYTGVVFLNDDFEGGEIEFISPKAFKTIVPKSGYGILFGAGLDYLHKVHSVTNGVRYSLRMFFQARADHTKKQEL